MHAVLYCQQFSEIEHALQATLAEVTQADRPGLKLEDLQIL